MRTPQMPEGQSKAARGRYRGKKGGSEGKPEQKSVFSRLGLPVDTRDAHAAGEDREKATMRAPTYAGRGPAVNEPLQSHFILQSRGRQLFPLLMSAYLKV